MMLIDDADVLAGDETPRSRGYSRSKPKLNDQTKRRLSTHLRALYESVLDQPVPDKFKELVARLDDERRD